MSPEKEFQKRIAERVEAVIEKCAQGKFQVVLEYVSPYGSAIRDQGRRVDIAVLNGKNPYLFIECKWQNTSGSAQDKLFRVLEEAKRDRLLGVHSVIVFGGEGWSKKIERWAVAEGMIREEWVEQWLERFFCEEK
ncbi:PD-(D/E)XK nuclease superfamily protein [Oceanithermus sp.]